MKHMVTDDLSSGQVETTLLDSVGGVFDYYGATRRQPRWQVIPHAGQYVGELTYLVDESGNTIVDELGNYIIAGNAIQMLQSQLDALKGMLGSRAQLWRRRDADDAEQWRLARLLSVAIALGQERVGAVATLDCQFETGAGGWRTATATTGVALTAAGVVKALNVDNGGNLVVNDAVITVACTSGTITHVEMEYAEAGIDFGWTGSLATGETLTIDCGVQTVRKGATDAYSGFDLHTEHTARGWLPLAVGLSTFLVTTTGGAATVTITFYPQFA